MPDPQVPQPDPVASKCPIDCPNRRVDGFVVFGYHIAPIEIALHIAILICLGAPAARASAQPEFGWKDGVAWFGAIAGASTFIRLSPTQRIDAYTKLIVRPPYQS